MKPTQTQLGEYYNLSRQTIATYKKFKPRTYEALRAYYILQHTLVGE